MLISPAYAQAADSGGSMLMQLAPLVLIFVVFYFLLIRPQQKKMKEHDHMVKNLQKGEEVITNAGIIGRIHGITEKVVTLEVDNNVKIKVLKNQVASVVRGDQPIA